MLHLWRHSRQVRWDSGQLSWRAAALSITRESERGGSLRSFQKSTPFYDLKDNKNQAIYLLFTLVFWLKEYHSFYLDNNEAAKILPYG